MRRRWEKGDKFVREGDRALQKPGAAVFPVKSCGKVVEKLKNC
jgi:hypothetical protein